VNSLASRHRSSSIFMRRREGFYRSSTIFSNSVALSRMDVLAVCDQECQNEYHTTGRAYARDLEGKRREYYSVGFQKSALIATRFLKRGEHEDS
jgi:hypothetical protein